MSDSTHVGHVIVLRYLFKTHEIREWRKPYYISPKGRWCFRWGAGTWNGLNPARIGQFEYWGDSAEMYTTPDRYHEDRAHFYSCVVKALHRRHLEIVRKYEVKFQRKGT